MNHAATLSNYGMESVRQHGIGFTLIELLVVSGTTNSEAWHHDPSADLRLPMERGMKNRAFASHLMKSLPRPGGSL